MSQRTGRVASAPGKLMLSGEYAVLEGAEAIVAAVDRRVRVWLAEPGADPVTSPEVVASRAEAERRWGPTAGVLQMDVSATRAGDQKLGVGSSAAGAAAAAGLVRAQAGGDLSALAIRREVMAAALAGHHAVAPRGSGADVAAATLGGFVRFRRVVTNGEPGDEPGDPVAVEVEPVVWPSDLQVRVVWTGQQVRTSDMLDRVEALRRSDAVAHADAMAGLQAAARQCSSALVIGPGADAPEAAAVVRAVRGYHLAMAALGDAAAAPIVNQTLHHIAELAARAGGAAKPSGAGGGDVALAMFESVDQASRFEAACQAAGLDVIHTRLGAAGVRIDA